MKIKCEKCGIEYEGQQKDPPSNCADCLRKLREAEEEEEKTRRSTSNLSLGDSLNTGIPGGFDMDFTTPF